MKKVVWQKKSVLIATVTTVITVTTFANITTIT